MEIAGKRGARVAPTGAIAALLMVVSVSGAPGAGAQETTPAAVTGSRAFATESLGGTVGSAVGIAIGLAVVRPNRCPSDDDVACALKKLGIVGVIGVAGATIGTVIGGRWVRTRPSSVGAFVGAAAGAAAGIGLEHFVTEEMGQQIGRVGTVVLFSVTQGILAAAGSRLVAGLRRD
jgi:hypothetical protein